MRDDLLKGLEVKTRTIPVEKIVTNLFVRTELNYEHAMTLACLIDDPGSTAKIDPILVIPEYEKNGDGEIHRVEGSDKYFMVYGRHRLHAIDSILDRAEIKALVIMSGVKTEAELISIAYRENCGGSLPPTTADTEHTIEALLERKVSKKYIAEMLALPPGLARKFINNVEERLERAKVRRAVHTIAEGSTTVAEAARAEGVEPEKVRAFIQGKKRRTKENEAEMIKREINGNYRSASNKNAGLMRSLVEKYDDGDVNAKFVFDVLRQIEALQARAAKNTAEWRKRFEAKIEAGK